MAAKLKIPREPTPEMVAAGTRALVNFHGAADEAATAVYRAMLSAAMAEQIELEAV